MFRVDRVEELLHQRGESAQEMLRQLNMGKNQFFQWKQNGRKPSMRAVESMAQHLDVSYDYLMDNTDDPSSQHTVKVIDLFSGVMTEEPIEPVLDLSYTMTKQEREIIEKYRSLSIEKQFAFLQKLLEL